ncbi:MAG: biosynthetic arginine decarboxylase [Planctomycetes bacterium]|nr:biosynthetic arginine decarboxylase [Planctomycetota bacterium]
MAENKNDRLRAWTIEDAADTYQINNWGRGFFSIDENGDVQCHLRDTAPPLSLPQIVDDLRRRGIHPPVLLRFSDILDRRIHEIHGAFAEAITTESYQGRYQPVYPIKVNQQRDVVEELIDFGADVGLGLEAGSKPELLISLAYVEDDSSLIVCNGYKDEGYVETALLGQQLGRHPILVIDRFEEIETIVRVSQRLEKKPNLGVRVRLHARGAGKWNESTGVRSKFGLTADEIMRLVEELRRHDMLECLELLHFHIGSQITAIRAIKFALREAARLYVELKKLCPSLSWIDVGGGLGVDYDGSKTNFHSSTNYTLQEYANDVVWTIGSVCDDAKVPHPNIVSESGRALVAHHAVLVFDVLGRSGPNEDTDFAAAAGHSVTPIRALYDTYSGLSRKNVLEAYHDAVVFKDEALSLFDHGIVDLEGRALTERLFWATCWRIARIVRELDNVPEELQGLERSLSDTLYCNFSVFQSIPDHWAVKQLFPIMPIHRLRERPRRSTILADLTCDSDGKVDEFIDFHDVKYSLEVHDPEPGKPYYLAAFLVGAYQETLGDLHNLFGDTHVVHIAGHEKHGYSVERYVEGNTVSEVLDAVRYDRRDVLRRVRSSAERAARRGDLSLEDSARLLRRYEEGLAGYTYLTGPDRAQSEPEPETGPMLRASTSAELEA